MSVSVIESQRQAQSSTEKPLNRFRTHFEQCPFSIQIFSPEGRSLEVNQAWRDLFCITDEFYSDYILARYNVLHDPLLESKGVMSFIKRGFQGEPTKVPAIYYDPSELGLPGRARWLEAFIYPMKDSQGKILELVLMHRDVTEQKQAEEELRKSKDEFEAIFNYVDDGIIVQDKDHRCLYVNEAGAKLCGYPSADSMKKNSVFEVIEEFEVRDDQGQIIKQHQLPGWKIFAGDPFPASVTLCSRNLKTNRHIWSIVNSHPILDSAQKPYLAVSIFKDITSRKRREDRQVFLTKAIETLSSTLDYNISLKKLAEFAVVSMADTCIIDLIEGDQARTMAWTNCNPESTELLDQYFAASPDRPLTKSVRAHAIETGKTVFIQSVTHTSLKQWAYDEHHLRVMKEVGIKSLLVVPIRTPSQVIGSLSLTLNQESESYTQEDVAFFEELGYRAGIAVENSLLYREAQRAIQSRDEFLSIASHELKTPLTSLKLQSQVFQRRCDRNDPGLSDPIVVKKLAQGIDRQVSRLNKLVDDILDISRIANSKLTIYPEHVDLAVIVRDVLDRTSDLFQHSGSKYRLTTESSVVGFWDPFRIDQVVTHLISNAIQYGEGKAIEISLTEENKCALLRVADQGVGIDEENLRTLFTRFHRVPSKLPGGGLRMGLFISHQIVESHQGSLQVQSQVGEGSVFTMQLPLRASSGH